MSMSIGGIGTYTREMRTIAMITMKAERHRTVDRATFRFKLIFTFQSRATGTDMIKRSVNMSSAAVTKR